MPLKPKILENLVKTKDRRNNMATSGTTTFNLDIADVIEEAMAMLGGEQTLGFEPLEARRTLNLLLIDWMNRGILHMETKLSHIGYNKWYS